MTPRTRVLAFAGLFTLVLLLIPFETVLVPEWRIRFVDEDGRPVAGVVVREICYHRTYSGVDICGQYSDSRQVTGSDGVVLFTKKSVWYGAVSRGARATVAYLTLFAHGSVGISAYALLGDIPREYTTSISTIDYKPGDDSSLEVVLESR